MRVKYQGLVFLCLLCSLTSLSAQSSVVISPPALSLINGQVQIEYDLLNCTAPELFTIRVEIVTESGITLTPRYISGDVGVNIICGSNKKILWDIEADKVFLDEEIKAQLFALPEKQPVSEKDPLEEAEADQEDPGIVTDSPQSTRDKTYSRTSLILQSAAFPGLGLSRRTGKPHWLKGVMGYGCIAGSIATNRMAYKSYQNYLKPASPAEADKLFKTAKSQKNTSQILGYTALCIWVADLVWTIMGTSEFNQQAAQNRKGLSIGASVVPYANTPLLAVRYQF